MKKPLGVLAEFSSSATLMYAAENLRDNGYKKFDCHSPFPIHGMDAAMGMKRSHLGFIIAFFAILGGLIGFGLQSWSHAIAYPIIISGKPYFAWQSYIIITFELFVLFAAFAAVFGMFKLNRLPMFHHPVFYSDRFSPKVTNDGFYVSIEANDPKFEPDSTADFLKSIGGSNVEILEEDA